MMKKLILISILYFSISIGFAQEIYILFKQIRIKQESNSNQLYLYEMGHYGNGNYYEYYYSEPISFKTKKELDNYIKNNNCNNSYVINFKEKNVYIVKSKKEFINELIKYDNKEDDNETFIEQ